MDYLIPYICTMATAVFALPAVLVLAFRSNHWLRGAMIWIIAPFLACAAVLLSNIMPIGGAAFSPNDTALGITFISAVFLLPWLALSALGAMAGSMIKSMLDE
jgi:hypothetical protein